jgi:hypothetical protein
MRVEVALRNFDGQEVTIACAVSLLAQLGFIAVFSLPSPKLVQADISNENSQPIAVAITPVLKLGSKTPSKLPSEWLRRRPVAAKAHTALPSPQAEKTPEAIPKAHLADASVAPIAIDAGRTEPLSPIAPEDASTVATAAPSQGSEQGAATGTETDPLKARAVDMYKAQLVAWFGARFHIAGKIPFDKLKALHSTTSVTVTGDRKVGSFSVVKPSGDSTFDSEVQATLARIQSDGVELPAPPQLYPEMLDKPLRIDFHCNNPKTCQ